MENKLKVGVKVIVGLVALVLTVEAMTCRDAINTMLFCIPYLTTEPSPTLVCCQSVAIVNASATTTQSRRELCQCFENNAPAFGVVPDKAKQLPGLCGVRVPVPIDLNVDCQSFCLILYEEAHEFSLRAASHRHRHRHRQWS
ncbi:hypothetical protein GQ457_13G014960 [Hibiscus cannabinus]